MLNTHSIAAAQNLMSLLDNEGTTLTALGDTPLAEMAHLTVRTGTVPTQGSDVDDMLMGQDLAELSRKRNVLGVSEHDITVEEIAPIVAEAVGAVLSIARNQVNPMIRRVVEQVEKRMDEDGHVEGLPVEIEPQYAHRIWRNPALSEMVSRYEETLQPSNTLKVRGVVSGEVDLLAAMKTGILDLDDDTQSLIEAKGEARLQELFHKYFRGGASGSILNDELDMDGVIAPYDLILVHLLALHFTTTIPDTEGVSLEEFQGYVATLRAATGRLIARRITMLDKAVAAKRLVIRYPSESQLSNLINGETGVKLVVNQLVYKRWLDDGGCPEILLGAALDDQNTNYRSLIERAEHYKKVWASHDRMVRLSRRNKTFNNLQNYIGVYIGKEIRDLDLETVPHTREEMHADLTTHVSHLCATDVDNLYETVRHILCNTIFKHTDALRILTEFDRLAEEKGQEDAREVALLVAVNYATDWVADMIMTDRVAS